MSVHRDMLLDNVHVLAFLLEHLEDGRRILDPIIPMLCNTVDALKQTIGH